MGDSKRSLEFSKYLRKNFKFKKTLCIADGNLLMAKQLYQDTEITVIDPNIRNNNIIKKDIKIIGDFFTCNYKEKGQPYDLIIGMHPDHATIEIIDYAIINKVNVAIVPCCILGRTSEKFKSKIAWIKMLQHKLNQANFETCLHQLPITGDNVLIKGIVRW